MKYYFYILCLCWAAPTVAQGWVSPSAHTDVNDKWSDEPNAYDNSSSTFAYDVVFQPPGIIEFEWSPGIVTPLWRIDCAEYDSASQYLYDPTLTVQLYYDGGWHTAWNNNTMDTVTGVSDHTWWEYPTSSEANAVTKMRVQMTYNGPTRTLRIYEVDLDPVWYLDTAASGANDGTSWSDAFESWAHADANLDALAGDGAGYIVEVNDGDYGAAVGGVLAKPRNDWLIIRAATGKDPNFTRIQADLGGAGSFYLHFEGLNIENDDSRAYGSGGGVVGDVGTEGYCLYFADGNDINFVDCTMIRATETVEGAWSPYSLNKTYNSYFENTDNVTIDGCEFRHGLETLTMGSDVCDNVMISDSSFHGFGDNGMKVHITDSNIVDCEIYCDWDANEYHELNVPWYLTGTVSYEGGGGFQVGETLTQAGTGAEGYYLTDSGEGAGKTVYFWVTSETLFNFTGSLTGGTSGATLTSVTGGDNAHSTGIQIDSDYANTVVIARNYVWGDMETNAKVWGRSSGHTFTIENNLFTAEHQIGYPCALLVGPMNDVEINNNICTERIRFSPCRSTEGGYDTLIDQMHNNIFSSLQQDNNANDGVIWIKNSGNNIYGNDPDGDGSGDHPFDVNDASDTVDYDLGSLFIGGSPYSYEHQPGALGIDYGNSGHGPATDILGESRDATYDAGCYEYIAGESPTGYGFIGAQ